jgi:hypothetical protein
MFLSYGAAHANLSARSPSLVSGIADLRMIGRKPEIRKRGGLACHQTGPVAVCHGYTALANSLGRLQHRCFSHALELPGYH